MKKTLFFDVETTGLNVERCSIIQLSGIIDIGGEIKEEFNFFIAPDPNADISDEALEITGKTRKEIQGYPSAKDVYSQFLEILDRHVNKYDKTDKFYPAGYNVRFDLEFLQSFFKKCGNEWGSGSYQNWKAIDVMQLAHFLCYDQKLNLENYKLQTLCSHFGIEIIAHDALSDIRATRLLLIELQNKVFSQRSI